MDSILDLDKQRRDQWRINGSPVTTAEDARAFIDTVGICLMYPLKPPVLLPTFVGAVIGDDRALPTSKTSYADPRALRASELARRLVANRQAFESNFFPDNSLLLSPAAFPYFYALAAERTSGGAPRESLSQLARLAWNVLQKQGPLTRDVLREKLNAQTTSVAAIERALGELWMRLRIVPVDLDGVRHWVSLERWAPEATKLGAHASFPVALSALISQYLQAVVAAEHSEIESFFTHLAPRSKIKEAVNAMLAAREFSFVNLGNRTMVQLTPDRVPDERTVPREKRGRSPRPQKKGA